MRPNVGGVYKAVKNMSVNVGGTWRGVKQGWTRVNGVWRPFFVQSLLLRMQMTNTGPNSQNNFHYETIANSNYVVKAGDKLVYDVFLDNNSSTAGLDCVMVKANGAKQDLRTENIPDQNNLSCHPATNIASYARGKWYSRSFNLNQIAGATISKWCAAFEEDIPATYGFYIRDAKIVDANGNTQLSIFTDSLQVSAQETYVGGDGYPTTNGYTISSLVKRAQTDMLKAGNLTSGYYGRVLEANFITVANLIATVGASNLGANGNANSDWLKFSRNGKELYFCLKHIKYVMTYNALDALGLATGSKVITVAGKQYKVRLITSAAGGTNEWDDLIMRVHSQGNADWDKLTAADFGYSSTQGYYCVGQKNPNANGSVVSIRAVNSPGTYAGTDATGSYNYAGWYPVLEEV